MTNLNRVAGGNELLDPAYLLKDVLQMSYGAKLADLGCGSMGFFVLQSAKLVGDKGLIYAVDILKDVLSSVEGRARQEGLYNVKTVWSNLEIVGAAKILENSLDYTLLINTLFQTKKHQAVLQEAYRLLKPSGQLLVVDWQIGAGPIGPTREMRLESADVKSLAQAVGFQLTKEFTAGKNHYGLIFQK